MLAIFCNVFSGQGVCTHPTHLVCLRHWKWSFKVEESNHLRVIKKPTKECWVSCSSVCPSIYQLYMSVCPIWAPDWKTKSTENNKNGVNVFQARRNWYAKFLFRSRSLGDKNLTLLRVTFHRQPLTPVITRSVHNIKERNVIGLTRC